MPPTQTQKKAGFYGNYGVYDISDPTDIEVWLPQKFTRVNQFSLGPQLSIGT